MWLPVRGGKGFESPRPVSEPEQWPARPRFRLAEPPARRALLATTGEADDVRFSNAMTTEHLTLGPGVIGYIWRQRSTDIATYAAMDRWLHYDQVGSVLSESGSSGTLAQRLEQDAFGNTVANWQSYTWCGA